MVQLDEEPEDRPLANHPGGRLDRVYSMASEPTCGRNGSTFFEAGDGEELWEIGGFDIIHRDTESPASVGYLQVLRTVLEGPEPLRGYVSR